jgi:hypothetical protein
MQARSWYLTLWFLTASIFLFTSSGARAQLVATRDLTQPRPPSPSSAELGNYANDYKDACNGSGQADGEIIDKRRDDHLGLSIVDAQPELRDGQALLTITVRLKNLNVYVPAEIPWELSPVTPLQTDPQNPTRSYEAATVRIWMERSKYPSELAILAGGITLWAQPGNQAHHLKLKPGEWVDIKFSVGVVCNSLDKEVCGSYLRGDSVILKATWYERELTHLRKGCVVTDGAYTAREFDSSPFDLANFSPSKAESPTANPSTTGQSK